jgi:hypothetical protein
MHNFNFNQFNPERFTASVEAKSVKEFLRIAKNFPGDTGLVPCWGNPEGKKVPCKGSDGWQNSSITKHDLSDFPNMEMLGLVLGKKYLSIDADGVTALEKLSEILGEFGLELPETLEVSSNLGVRHCWFFEIPENFQGDLEYFQIETKKATETEANEQLEFRTGKQYQIIAGIHPLTKSAYLSNQNFTIAESPQPWLDFVKNKGEISKLSLQSSKTSKSSAKASQQEVEILPASLYAFVSKETKAFLRYGICEGSRNISSFKAACDLLGTAAKLEELEIPFEGNPERLFFEVFSKIPQGDSEFSIEEFQTCWNSANNQDRDCVKDDEILLSIAGIWEDEYQPGVSYEVIEDRVSKKLGENPQKIKKESLIVNFKANFPSPTSAEVQIEAQIIYRELGYKGFGSLENDLVFNSLIKELTEEKISDEDKKQILQYVQDIKEKKQHRIDFEPVRNKYKNVGKQSIVEFALNHARKSGVPDEFAMISMLTTLSSLLPKDFIYSWNEDVNLRPNIFTVLVAPAAFGKDKIFGTFTRPLQLLATKAINEYDDIKKLSKEVLSEWNSLGKKERDEVLAQYANLKGLFLDELSNMEKKALFFEMNNAVIDPKKAHPYLINQASMQSVNKQSGEFTEFGLLLNPSELKGFIDNTNTVNKNKSGLDVLLPVWNGDPTLSTTKTEELTTRADWYQCSLLSGIQNKRFESLFDLNDPSGIGSRFLYLTIDTPIRTKIRTRQQALRDKGDFDLLEFYLDFQKKMSSLIPEIEEFQRNQTVIKKGKFIIETEENSKAQELFTLYYDHCMEKALNMLPVNEAIYAWYARLAENMAKFALVIHLLRWYYGLEEKANIISEDAWLETIQLGQFFESQYEMLIGTLGESGKASIDDESLFMYERMLNVCCKYASKHSRDFVYGKDLVGDAILRRNDFLTKYCTKKAKQLNKPEIHTVWQEMHDLGLGTFDKVSGSFKPNRELIKA